MIWALVLHPIPMVGVGGSEYPPTPPSNSRNINQVSYNLTQFRHYLPRDSVRSHRLRGSVLQDTPSPLQMPITSSATDYKLEVPTTTYLGSFNLLEKLTELRETFYLLEHQFITKEYNSGTTRWRRCIRKGIGKKHRVSMFSWNTPLSPNFHVFTNVETLQILSFQVFLEASGHKQIN